MSFGAIGVEIMAKIKIMRVVIGFTKKEKRKRGNNHVKKEISSGNSSSNGSTDAFYYAVFNYPKDTARYQYAYHTKMSSRTGTVHPQYYKSVTAGQTMYLQADTDKYIVWADGYWFS